MSAVRPSSRLPDIAAWLRRQGLPPRRVDAITGDVSLRRYFRIHFEDGGTGIVAYYPPTLRPVCRRFRVTTALLGEVGVPAPKILRNDCHRGLMLLEDSGERTLYDEAERDWTALAPIYRRAVEHARRIGGLPRERVAPLNTWLDASLLRWEIDRTWKLALAPRGLVGPPPVERAFATALQALCDELGREDRLVPCHRDFMPRNLMRRRGPGGDEEVLVLDHQDLRLGPPAYDLASLLNDSLFPPPALEAELVGSLLPGQQGALDYRRAVVQRALKAVGTYSAFAERGFDRHLKLVAPTLARAWRWFASVPELRPLRPELLPAWREQLGDLVD
jgi:N-acetylmuramate 1-kinase